MKKISVLLFFITMLGQVYGQEAAPVAAGAEGGEEKARPPRIPDAPFVPKRNMVKREKGQFWAGPPDEGRFGQILALTLVPKERLHEKLAAWPNYQELDGAQRARLEERIDQVRQTARKLALDVAKEFGLRVGQGQEDDFIRMYWSERVKMDFQLWQELSPKRKKLEEESEARILQKFPKADTKP